MRKAPCWCPPTPCINYEEKVKPNPCTQTLVKRLQRRIFFRPVKSLDYWFGVGFWVGVFFYGVSLQLRKQGLGSGGVSRLASGTRAAPWVEKPPEMLRKIHPNLSSRESGMSDQAGSCSNLSQDINVQIPGTSGRAASFALGHTPSLLTRSAL